VDGQNDLNEQEKYKLVCRPPDIMSDDRIFLAWQRSHMANERTFLSWSRTSISLLAFGFVIERFDIFMEHIMRLGGFPVHGIGHKSMMYLSLFCFFIAGLATLVSGLRFLQMRRNINTGEASFSILPDILVVICVLAVIVLVIVLLLPRLFDAGLIPA
jgi:putative membrane protein